MGYESKYKGKFVQRLANLHRESPGVSFSTDYMTPQQIKALSGPVHIYYIGKGESYERESVTATLASMAPHM
ncbi:hypothetical protein D3C77_478640 [compost metagenome]